MGDNLPQRKHPRLKNYDYSSAGAYFVTICTQNRRCVLSRIVGREQAPRPTLSDIVCAYKSIVTIKCKKEKPVDKLFQTSFHEHVIRGREDYLEIAGYIEENPLRRELDKLFSEK